jgi:hypothetical protein
MAAELESQLEDLREAGRRFRRLPHSDSHQPGPPDPVTGERWDRFNVLGHMAEMLVFWSRQLGAALSSDGRFGRQPHSSARLDGIESGHLLSESDLRSRIDAGLQAAEAFLQALQPEDLDRPLQSTTRGEMTLRQAIDYYLVGHFRDHVTQLEELQGSHN